MIWAILFFIILGILGILVFKDMWLWSKKLDKQFKEFDTVLYEYDKFKREEAIQIRDFGIRLNKTFNILSQDLQKFETGIQAVKKEMNGKTNKKE